MNPTAMTFGKHKGQSLQDLPPSYLSWLISQEIYVGKDDLTIALIERNYLSPRTATESASTTPPKKRVNSLETQSPILSSSVTKFTISKEAKRNGTMLNYDGTAYILDFGKHAGQKLSHVPPTYMDWLIATNVHHQRLDLAAALREGGMPGLSEESLMSMSRDIVVERASNPHMASDNRFFEPITLSTLWISDADTYRYFGLSEPLLTDMGVNLVSEQKLRRKMEFGELVTIFEGPKRWLWQVYVCVERCGGLGGAGGGDGVDEALGRFLGKNGRREREIWDAMGFE